MGLPQKRSFSWVYVFFASYIINFMSIVLSRNIIGSYFDAKAVVVFAVAAFVISALICLGYFGLRVFAIIFLIADFIALSNILYICANNKNEGWTDLTSMFVFLFIIILGLLIALLVQVISWTISISRRDKKAALEANKPIEIVSLVPEPSTTSKISDETKAKVKITKKTISKKATTKSKAPKTKQKKKTAKKSSKKNKKVSKKKKS